EAGHSPSVGGIERSGFDLAQTRPCWLPIPFAALVILLKIGTKYRIITSRFPWIGEAALKNRVRQFVIDGEAVILGVDGYSDFNALHSGRHNDRVQAGAFDVLAMDGDALRNLPLSMRKANLAR